MNPSSDAELSFAVRVGLLLNALVGAVSLLAVLIWLLRYSVRLSSVLADGDRN
jgi:hypothetical protein